MKTLTEADYARIRQEAVAVRNRALGIQIPEPEKELPCPPKRTPRASKPSGSRPPTYNREKIKNLYLSGMSMREVASVLGAHRATVHRALTASGVSVRSGSGGPQRRSTCARGHSMLDALEVKGGGRACRKCKQKRDREAAKRRYWAKKEAA